MYNDFRRKLCFDAGDCPPAFFILGRFWPPPYLGMSFGFGRWTKPSTLDPRFSVNSDLKMPEPRGRLSRLGSLAVSCRL
jgi:hypothetical protein